MEKDSSTFAEEDDVFDSFASELAYQGYDPVHTRLLFYQACDEAKLSSVVRLQCLKMLMVFYVTRGTNYVKSLQKMSETGQDKMKTVMTVLNIQPGRPNGRDDLTIARICGFIADRVLLYIAGNPRAVLGGVPIPGVMRSSQNPLSPSLFMKFGSENLLAAYEQWQQNFHAIVSRAVPYDHQIQFNFTMASFNSTFFGAEQRIHNTLECLLLESKTWTIEEVCMSCLYYPIDAWLNVVLHGKSSEGKTEIVVPANITETIELLVVNDTIKAKVRRAISYYYSLPVNQRSTKAGLSSEATSKAQSE